MMVKTVVDRVVWILNLDKASSLYSNTNIILLILQDRQTVLMHTAANTQSHEYFLHLFGEEFLDAVTA